MNIWRKLTKIVATVVGRTPRRRKAHLLLVGLNNAGKSTLLNRLKPDRDQMARKLIAPTVGFVTDKFTFGNVRFTATDMSGRDGYRAMWESMYGQCDAIVFVVDSADRMRLAVAKDELDMLLRHPDVAGRPDMPVLFVANKTAAADACAPHAVAGALRLDQLMEPGRPWRLAGADASSAPDRPDRPADDGLMEAMEWLTDLVQAASRRRR